MHERHQLGPIQSLIAHTDGNRVITTCPRFSRLRWKRVKCPAKVSRVVVDVEMIAWALPVI
jgi:hypothetical protein